MDVRNLLTGLLLVLFQFQILAKDPPSPEIISVSVKPGSDSVTMKWNVSEKIDTFIIYEALNDFQRVPGSGIDVYNPSSYEFTFSYPLVHKSPVQFSIISVKDKNTSPLAKYHRTIYMTSQWDSCNSRIKMKWTNYHGWGNQLKNYEVYSEVNGNIKKEGATTDTIYEIPNVAANHSYLVYVKAINIDPTISSRSNDSLVFTRMTPPPAFIVAKQASFNGQSVKLTFGLDPASGIDKYDLYASDQPDGNFSLITSFTGQAGKSILEYTDELNVLASRYYYLKAINNCGIEVLKSSLATAIVPTLSVRNNVINLEWNAYKDWDLGIDRYEVWRSVDGVFTNIGQTKSTVYQDDIQTLMGQNFSGNLCYYILSYSVFDGIHERYTSRSAQVCIDLSENIFIPNAFTPNGDGRNDEFKPGFPFLPSDFTLLVYNRNGFKIFESKDPLKGWDGTVNGKKAPEGTYIFFIRFSSQNGKVIEKRGNFSVINSKAE